jgi:LysM repeat protein
MVMLIDNAGTSRGNRNDYPSLTPYIKRSQDAQQSTPNALMGSRLQQQKVVVEQGDTLTEIAKQHHVSLKAAINHNPQLRNPDHILVGDVIFLPPPAPDQLAVAPEGKTLFLENLQARGNAVEYAETSEGAVDYRAEFEYLTQDVEAFLSTLAPEQRQDTAQWLFDHDWTDCGPAQVALEQGSKQLGLALEPSSHKGPEIETSVRDITAQVSGSPDPAIALQTLSKAYASASLDVQQALLLSPKISELFQRAGLQALEPLRNRDQYSEGPLLLKSVFERLDNLTQDIEPRLASEVVEAALPGVERALLEPSDSPIPFMIGPSGSYHLVNVTGRIAGQPDSESLLKRLTALGLYERTGTLQSLADGASPAYPLEILNLVSPDDPRAVLEGDILPGLSQFQQKVTDDIQAYQSHMEELHWLTTNGSAVMTEAQREVAVQDYLDSRSPEWESQTQTLKDQIAEDGRDLWKQLEAIANVSEQPKPGHEALHEHIKTIMDSPDAITALEAAMGKYPELTSNFDSLKLIGQVGKATDRGRKFLEEVAAQALRQYTLPAYQDVKLGDPASIQKALKRLDKLKSSPLAQIMGVTDTTFSGAVDSLKKALPQPGDTPEKINQRLMDLNDNLKSLNAPNGMKTFDSKTKPGQAFRLLGAAGAAAVLLNSGSKVALGQDTSPAAVLKSCLDLAGFSQKGIELLLAKDALPPQLDPYKSQIKDFAGGSTRPAVKALGVASALFDLNFAVKAAEAGDTVSASLYTLSTAGGVTSALGTGTLLRPIGVGAVLFATISLAIHDYKKHREVANRFETPVTAPFLEHAGSTEEAAQILSNQSGNGYSILPMLGVYAERKGLNLLVTQDQAAFVSWVNDMPTEKLELLRDNLHHALDKRDGSYKDLPLQREQSDSWFFDTSDSNFDQRLLEYPHFLDMGVAYPNSVYQLDRTLTLLELDTLAVS